MAGGIFADLSAHLKPDRGMEESIIMARCGGDEEASLRESIINLHGRRGGWEEEKDSGMQTVPAVTPLTSRGRLASLGVNPNWPRHAKI